jgi:hypothetical protein
MVKKTLLSQLLYKVAPGDLKNTALPSDQTVGFEPALLGIYKVKTFTMYCP